PEAREGGAGRQAAWAVAGAVPPVSTQPEHRRTVHIRHRAPSAAASPFAIWSIASAGCEAFAARTSTPWSSRPTRSWRHGSAGAHRRKRWVALGGDSALPAKPALTGPQAVEPPTAREALDDEIEF